MLIFIFLARLLSVSEFGVYRQLFLIHQIITGVFFAAVPTSLLYFCGRSEMSARGGLIRVHLKLVIAVALVATFLIAVSGPLVALVLSSPDLKNLVYVFAPYTGAYMLYSLVAPTMIAYGKSFKSTLFSCFLALINTVPVLLVAAYGMGLQAVIFSASLAAVVGGGVALVLILRLSSTEKGWHSDTKVRDVLIYVWPLLLASGISLVGLRMDQVVVSTMRGAEEYGRYVVGAFEVPLFGMLQSSISSVLTPVFAALAVKQNWPEIVLVWRKAVFRSAVITYPVAAALFVVADVFITYIFGAKFQDSAVVFQVCVLLAPLRVVTFGLLLRASGNTKPDLYGALVYLPAVIVCSYCGVSYFGLVGAMGAVLICTACQTLWLARCTRVLTSGSVTLSDIYPAKLFLCFPAVVALYWILLRELVFEYFELTSLFKLSFAAGVAVLTSLIGLHFLRRRQLLLGVP